MPTWRSALQNLAVPASAQKGGDQSFCLGAQSRKLKLQWKREGRGAWGEELFRGLFLVEPELYLVHPS